METRTTATRSPRDVRERTSPPPSTTGPIVLGDPPPSPPPLPSEEEMLASWGGLASPLVTCICHTYNHANFIEQALQGMLGQTTRFPFEIIVHDDASTDGTPEVIEAYARRYPRLIRAILQKENQYRIGRKPSCFTMHKARGEFIALCEGDDYWIDERKLQIQSEQLRQTPWAVIAHHDAIIIEDGVVTSLSKLPRGNRRNFSSIELQRAPWLLTASLMFKSASRPAIPDNYLNVVNGDKLLLSVLGLQGGAVYSAGLHPAVYRRHSGGHWSQRHADSRRAHQFQLYFSLALYHRMESGRPDIADHFLSEGLRRAITGRARRIQFALRFLWREVRGVLPALSARIRGLRR